MNWEDLEGSCNWLAATGKGWQRPQKTWFRAVGLRVQLWIHELLSRNDAWHPLDSEGKFLKATDSASQSSTLNDKTLVSQTDDDVVKCCEHKVERRHFLSWKLTNHLFQKDSGLPGCDAIWMGQWLPTFGRKVVTPYSRVEKSKKLSCFTYPLKLNSSTLQIKTVGSFETSEITDPLTRRHIPEQLGTTVRRPNILNTFCNYP